MSTVLAAAQAAAAAVRPDGVQATVRVTIIADGKGMNILSPYSLFPYGWEVHYSGSSEGSTWEVPGVKTFCLRVTPGKAHAFVDLVKIPAVGGAPGASRRAAPRARRSTRCARPRTMYDGSHGPYAYDGGCRSGDCES